jgi:hypothetical protein
VTKALQNNVLPPAAARALGMSFTEGVVDFNDFQQANRVLAEADTKIRALQQKLQEAADRAARATPDTKVQRDMAAAKIAAQLQEMQLLRSKAQSVLEDPRTRTDAALYAAFAPQEAKGELAPESIAAREQAALLEARKERLADEKTNPLLSRAVDSLLGTTVDVSDYFSEPPSPQGTATKDPYKRGHDRSFVDALSELHFDYAMPSVMDRVNEDRAKRNQAPLPREFFFDSERQAIDRKEEAVLAREPRLEKELDDKRKRIVSRIAREVEGQRKLNKLPPLTKSAQLEYFARSDGILRKLVNHAKQLSKEEYAVYLDAGEKDTRPASEKKLRWFTRDVGYFL